MRLLLVPVLLQVGVFALREQQPQGQPEVSISQGVLRGLYDKSVSGRTIASFQGVPYAKPPIGERRFRRAEEPDKWPGIWNATRLPTECLQLDHFYYNSSSELHGSEDCLYLNVFAPAETLGNRNAKLDVIAFIHGGAFMFMSSAYFAPNILLNRDVILVMINYRLGPLGFLTTGDDVVPGNNGLKDQQAALIWIQKNIEAFGGNPKSVTLGGLSAGGASVHYHLMSPTSSRLFHKAIIMSGSALNPWSQTEAGPEKARFVADQLGCPVGDSRLLVDCLRARPATRIVDLSRHFLAWLYNPYTPFGPAVEPNQDGALITREPIVAINQHEAADIPLLVSFTSEEGIYPGGDILREENIDYLKNNWVNLLPHILDYNYTLPSNMKNEVADMVSKEYNINLDHDYGISNFIKMIGDRLFLHGIVKAVTLHAQQNKAPIYVYKFSHKGKYSGTSFFSKRDLGVSHGDDLFYTLYSKLVDTQISPADKKLSEQMTDMWVTFAREGKLKGNWTPVQESLPKIAYTEIKGPDAFVQRKEDLAQRLRFWETLGFNENSPQDYCTKDKC